MRNLTLILIVLLFSCQGALDFGDESALTQSDDDPETVSDNDDDTTIDPVVDPDPQDDPDMGADAFEEEVDMGSPEDMGVADMRPAPGSVVEFRIPAGAGEGPWNSPDTAVVVYVGQILRVINDDSIDHQIHAPDDGAIDHGGRLSANGGSENYDVTRSDPLDPGRTNYYDHGLGRPANFWIDARD